MSIAVIPRPRTDEYDPYYAGYIARVEEGDLCARLRAQLADATRFLSGLSDAQALHRYAPGKWSVKEVLGHVLDSERIMAYRALRVARGDATPLPGYDQDALIPAGGFDRRSMQDLLAEFRTIREASVSLLASFDEAALGRRGTANDKPVSARALAYIIAGHELHHLEVVRTKYL